jgi:hypothetical protein
MASKVELGPLIKYYTIFSNRTVSTVAGDHRFPIQH